jgi:hypothetical protein
MRLHVLDKPRLASCNPSLSGALRREARGFMSFCVPSPMWLDVVV